MNRVMRTFFRKTYHATIVIAVVGIAACGLLMWMSFELQWDEYQRDKATTAAMLDKLSEDMDALEDKLDRLPAATFKESLQVAEAEPEPEYISLGDFRVTVYTPYCDGGVWGYRTATGATSEHLSTCAVDPEIIPLGSVVKVNGLTLRAVDTGSAVVGNMVDVFFDGTRAEALEWIAGFGDKHEVRKHI